MAEIVRKYGAAPSVIYHEGYKYERQSDGSYVKSALIGSGWVGVDLDGTLAYYPGNLDNPLEIGRPIPRMVRRVKRMLAEGEDVRIFTARVDGGEGALAAGDEVGELYRDVAKVRKAIQKWCRKHLGVVLPITNRKDYGMKRLYDDRAIHVERNTGRILG